MRVYTSLHVLLRMLLLQLHRQATPTCTIEQPSQHSLLWRLHTLVYQCWLLVHSVLPRLLVLQIHRPVPLSAATRLGLNRLAVPRLLCKLWHPLLLLLVLHLLLLLLLVQDLHLLLQRLLVVLLLLLLLPVR
jgi:hypothetical protein